MKCSNCNKSNSDSAKFCKYCGSPLQQAGFKTCENGHNYDASLSKCPFCPTTDYSKTIRELGNEKTVLDNSAATLKNNSKSDGKTVIDNSPSSIKSYDNKNNADVTVLVNPNNYNVAQPNRRLVGWLVTFDLNPNGLDFKLYEGRNVIGRSINNDITISHSSVSDKHCVILFRNDKFLISDELSTNGTYVNNQIIEDKTFLNDNDIIRLGGVNLKFRTV